MEMYLALAVIIVIAIYLILNINNVDYSCLVLGIITILTIFIIPKKIKRIIPAEIIALILCTYISSPVWLFRWLRP